MTNLWVYETVDSRKRRKAKKNKRSVTQEIDKKNIRCDVRGGMERILQKANLCARKHCDRY